MQEYELLMERYVSAQIAPFIDRFLVTINEYRENIQSEDEVNRAKAEYVRDALNKFTDDDCGGAGLGELLLNETVYEMAKPVYDALTPEQKQEKCIAAVNAEVRDAIPAAEKNDHCDILTLFAQADGQTMLVICDLITRAADTSDDSWVDRLTTYDVLLDSYEMAPIDAAKQAARDYEDDAKILLQSWEDFCTLLIGVDDDVAVLDRMDPLTTDSLPDAELNETTSDTEIIETIEEDYAAFQQYNKTVELAENITVADYLESIAYGDGTLYNFFTHSAVEAAEDITSLYPVIAALSAGQRAGIRFLFIRELVMMDNRETEYDAAEFDGQKAVSVYEDVDRAIYEKGRVALTSDTLRMQALEQQKNLADRNFLSTRSIVLWAVTGTLAVGFIGSFVGFGVRASQLKRASHSLQNLKDSKAHFEELLLNRKNVAEKKTLIKKHKSLLAQCWFN